MPALKIQLSEALRSRAEARATESGFDSLEAYVEALLLADATGGKALGDEQLEALLLGRLDGPFVEVDDADFRQMRAKFDDRLSRPESADPPERP